MNPCAHHPDSILKILSYYVYIFANHFKVSYCHHCHFTFEYFSTSPKKKKGIFHRTRNHHCTKKFSNVSWCALISSPYFSIPSCPKVWSQLHFPGSCELWSLHQSDGASVTDVSLLRHHPPCSSSCLLGLPFGWGGWGEGHSALVTWELHTLSRPISDGVEHMEGRLSGRPASINLPA